MNKTITTGISQILTQLFATAWQTDPHLAETPERVQKALRELISENYIKTEPPTMKVFTYKSSKSNEMIFKGPLQAISMCPHHILPYRIEAYFAYIPNAFLIGISKPGRLLDWCAKRMIVQELLGNLFIETFDKKVAPQGSILYLRGFHSCEQIRGAKQRESATTTLHSSGVFALTEYHETETTYRKEFFNLLSLERSAR